MIIKGINLSERSQKTRSTVDYLSWKSRIFRSLLLVVCAMLILLNVVYMIGAVSMGFPVSTALNVWVYVDLSLAILLILTAIGLLMPRLTFVKIGAAVSALSSVLFFTLAVFVVLNIFGGGSYRRSRLIDMAVLVGLPLALSSISLLLQLNLLRQQREKLGVA